MLDWTCLDHSLWRGVELRSSDMASHHGGIWEKRIRSARAILISLLKCHQAALTDESLQMTKWQNRRHPQLQTTYCRSHQWCQQSSTFDAKYAAYSKDEGHHASSRIIQFHRHVQSQTMEENTTSGTGVLVMVAKIIFGNTSGAREMEKAQKKPSNRWHDLTERRNWTSESANGTCYWSISRQLRSCTFGEDQDGK